MATKASIYSLFSPSNSDPNDGLGLVLPKNYNYNGIHPGYNNMSNSSILGEFAQNPSITPAARTQANNTGGFFDNGKDLGFNFDTAKFGFGALSSIMQLFGANEARKSIKAQTEFARRNLENSELAYNDRVAFRGRSAEASKSTATDQSVNDAEARYVSRYGTGGLLAKGGLHSKDETPAA